MPEPLPDAAARQPDERQIRDAACAAAEAALFDRYGLMSRIWVDVHEAADVVVTAALKAAAPALRAQGATAERARIIAAGGISQCCGAEYHREPGRYGRFQCHACGEECDLIGTIG